MASTKIQWATKVWNPVTGCNKISEACDNCYAEKFARRLQNNPNDNIRYKYRNGFKVTTHPESLKEPEQWKKPQRVFVCSMGDLFHEDVPFEFILKVFEVMLCNPQHTFLLLTKRPDIMKNFIDKVNLTNLFDLKNIWFGVTAENQARFNERVPILLEIKASIHFVSVEPMLGEIDLKKAFILPDVSNEELKYHWLDWIIVGGETGQKARPINKQWVNDLHQQCVETNVPFFFKQWGGKDKTSTIDGKEIKQFPFNK